MGKPSQLGRFVELQKVRTGAMDRGILSVAYLQVMVLAVRRLIWSARSKRPHSRLLATRLKGRATLERTPSVRQLARRRANVWLYEISSASF